MVKGVILFYKDGLTKTEITTLSNDINGRVSRITYMGEKVNYYYPGILDDIKYSKLKEGAYFIKADDDTIDCISSELGDRIKLMIADLEISDDDLYTAREFWNMKVECLGWNVKNL